MEAEQRDREMLKQRSEARVKNWPNTIEALRLRKEIDRRERLEREEDARRALDAEEAQYQAARREAAIERANLILYEQDDRIKALNSKMLLSNVLDERQKQIELKEQRKEMERQKEAAWHAELEHQVVVQQMKEEEEKQQRIVKAHQTQREQKEQLQEVEQRVQKMRMDAKNDGLEIRRTAEKAVRDEQEAEMERRRQAQLLNQEYRRVNEELKQMKAEQERLSKEEDAKMEQFAKVKEGQMLERKRRMEEKFRNDMAKRQAQIDKQSAYLEELRRKHDERLDRQIEAVAAENESKEQEKREKREREWKATVESRSRQLALKQARKEQDLAEQLAFKQQRQVAAELMGKEDRKETQQRQEASKRLFEFHQMQREDKKGKEEAERAQEKLEGQMMKQALEEEEAMFSRYVNSVMADYTAKGRNVSLMRPVKRRGDTI
eukprot:GGOE01036601.1.p1 GENE.GGOE01036601.1~~GGOE01036601.1.p1  ORF type:complete len:480 (+),score=207.48 GGOE01036601.1:135-1442(+)